MKRTMLVGTLLLLAFASTACQKTSSADNETTVTSVVQVNGSLTVQHCGFERWSVKTGTDPLAAKVNLNPQASTVAALGAQVSPLPKVTSKYPPQTPRQASEEQTYTVKATITEFSAQQDGDLHLVLKDGKHSMIAEIPNPSCVKGGPFLTGIAQARADFLAKTHYVVPIVPKGSYAPKWVKVNLPATITGVGFFDFPHSQAGVAPNAIELHPVLAVKF